MTGALHRPERHNSWTARMHAEYRWIMAELETDPAVRVTVLTGSGSTFCVGADSRAAMALATQALIEKRPPRFGR